MYTVKTDRNLILMPKAYIFEAADLCLSGNFRNDMQFFPYSYRPTAKILEQLLNCDNDNYNILELSCYSF